MRRGTRVGQAYVAITADGSGINEEIADEFEKFDSKGMAERHGQTYRNAFLGEMKKLNESLDAAFTKDIRTKAGRKLNSMLARSFETEDAMTLSVQKKVQDAFKSGAFDDLLKRAGYEAGESFGTQFDVAVKNAVLQSVEQSMLDAARQGRRKMDFVRGVNAGDDTLVLPGSDTEAALAAARQAGEAARKNREAELAGVRERIRLEQQALDQYNAKQRERMRLADEELSDRAERMAAIADLWADMDHKHEVAQRAETQRIADRSALLASIEQRRRDDLNEYNRREIAAEQAVRNAAKARADDDKKFLKYREQAAERLSKIRFDPKIDRNAIEKVGDDLRDALERRDDLVVQLGGDLPEREIARIRAELRALDSKIRLSVDEGHLNRSLLAAQGRINGVSGNGRSGGVGGLVGRMLGAGSRNNFLNVIGKSIGGLVGLADKARVGATSMFKTFIEGGRQAGESMSFLRGGLTALVRGGAEGGGVVSRLFGSIAKSGPAAAVAIGVVVLALSALMSVVGALVGILTALVSTIVSGLVGALAVLAPAIMAVVTAGGLLTAAFMSMTDAQKSMLKDAFVPLRQEMVGIGQLMIGPMSKAFGTWSTNLQNALALAIPVASRLGETFARAGNIITASLSGPGFQRFAESMTTYLPGIITSLSRALGNFLNGALGLFAAIMPYVSQFANWLQRVARNFSDWANSVQGQNAIKDFVGRAVASLQSLWDFTKQFFGFLSDVFFSRDAQNAGNTIFDSLADAFRDMRDAVQKAIKNGDLKKWLQDAIEFGAGLWSVVQGLYEVFLKLYNSKVLGFISISLQAIGIGMKYAADGADFFVSKIWPMINPVIAAAGALANLAEKIQWVQQLTGQASGKSLNGAWNGTGAVNPATGAPYGFNGPFKNEVGAVPPNIKVPSLPDVIGSGADALANTTVKGPAKPKKFKNPYADYAKQILKDAPGIAASIKNALLDTAEQVAKAITDATTATGGDSVTSALTNLSDSIVSSAEQTVNSAQQSLFSAAQSLASAGSMKAANKALREVKRAQKGVKKAQADQARINAASKMLMAQSVVTESNVLALVSGNLRVNATLADIAEARARVATLIDDANAKVEQAIQMRDSFKDQIADSIKSFGSLLEAQAQTINGIQQQLTSNDIIVSMQERLAKIKKFQENLRLLLSLGISQDVYRQLVEAGVEGGSAYADALVAGGPGAIGTVNQLVSDIGKTADEVGLQASDRLYQAGVDSAQAWLDGLKSIESNLAAQAEILGRAIGDAIQRGLGTIALPSIPSSTGPSSGGGGGGGGYNGGAMLGTPSNPITPTPLNTNNTGRPMPPITVVTPTEDPHAVAAEVWNELAGRL